MKIVPKTDHVVGRIVDYRKTQGGLHLATSEIKNLTVYLFVDAIGPDVTRCKPGDVVLYSAVGHVYTRTGEHLGIINEKAILGEVLDLDMSLMTINGKPALEVLSREAAAQDVAPANGAIANT